MLAAPDPYGRTVIRHGHGISSCWVAWLRLRWDAAPVASHRSAAPGWPFDPNSPSDCHRQCPIEKPRARFSTHSPALSFIFMLFKILGPLDLSIFPCSSKFVFSSLVPCFPVAWSPAFSSLLLSLSLSSQDFSFHSLLGFTTLTSSVGGPGGTYLIVDVGNA